MVKHGNSIVQEDAAEGQNAIGELGRQNGNDGSSMVVKGNRIGVRQTCS